MAFGWLIYAKKDVNRNKSYIEWFTQEAKKQNIKLQLILREDLQIGIVKQKLYLAYKGKVGTLPDFAVIRTVEPLLNKQLEKLGIPCFNSYEISALCNHKMKTYLAMKELNIPMMDTLMLRRDHLLDQVPMEFPFVIKESTGRGGEQVYYIENDMMWKNAFQKFKTEDLVLQSTNVQKGKDLRVFVIGKEIIQAVLRENEGKFRANYSLGGKAIPYHLSSKERQLVQKIIDAYDFDLVGIDFLIDYDGRLIFNEIEDVVGSRILSAVSDVNLLEKYIKHIQTKINP